MIDYNGEEKSFKAIVCGCGKKYLTKKLKNKLPETIRWRSVEGFIPLQKVQKKEKTIVDSRNKKAETTSSTSTNQICPLCGMPNVLFANKGMCWSCYKEMMSSHLE